MVKTIDCNTNTIVRSTVFIHFECLYLHVEKRLNDIFDYRFGHIFIIIISQKRWRERHVISVTYCPMHTLFFLFLDHGQHRRCMIFNSAAKEQNKNPFNRG